MILNYNALKYISILRIISYLKVMRVVKVIDTSLRLKRNISLQRKNKPVLTNIEPKIERLNKIRRTRQATKEDILLALKYMNNNDILEKNLECIYENADDFNNISNNDNSITINNNKINFLKDKNSIYSSNIKHKNSFFDKLGVGRFSFNLNNDINSVPNTPFKNRTKSIIDQDKSKLYDNFNNNAFNLIDDKLVNITKKNNDFNQNKTKFYKTNSINSIDNNYINKKNNEYTIKNKFKSSKYKSPNNLYNEYNNIQQTNISPIISNINFKSSLENINKYYKQIINKSNNNYSNNKYANIFNYFTKSENNEKKVNNVQINNFNISLNINTNDVKNNIVNAFSSRKDLVNPEYINNTANINKFKRESFYSHSLNKLKKNDINHNRKISFTQKMIMINKNLNLIYDSKNFSNLINNNLNSNNNSFNNNLSLNVESSKNKTLVKNNIIDNISKTVSNLSDNNENYTKYSLNKNNFNPFNFVNINETNFNKLKTRKENIAGSRNNVLIKKKLSSENNKEFLDKRCSFIDNNIIDIKKYCKKSSYYDKSSKENSNKDFSMSLINKCLYKKFNLINKNNNILLNNFNKKRSSLAQSDYINPILERIVDNDKNLSMIEESVVDNYTLKSKCDSINSTNKNLKNIKNNKDSCSKYSNKTYNSQLKNQNNFNQMTNKKNNKRTKIKKYKIKKVISFLKKNRSNSCKNFTNNFKKNDLFELDEMDYEFNLNYDNYKEKEIVLFINDKKIENLKHIINNNNELDNCLLRNNLNLNNSRNKLKKDNEALGLRNNLNESFNQVILNYNNNKNKNKNICSKNESILYINSDTFKTKKISTINNHIETNNKLILNENYKRLPVKSKTNLNVKNNLASIKNKKFSNYRNNSIDTYKIINNNDIDKINNSNIIIQSSKKLSKNSNTNSNSSIHTCSDQMNSEEEANLDEKVFKHARLHNRYLISSMKSSIKKSSLTNTFTKFNSINKNYTVKLSSIFCGKDKINNEKNSIKETSNNISKSRRSIVESLSVINNNNEKSFTETGSESNDHTISSNNSFEYEHINNCNQDIVNSLEKSNLSIPNNNIDINSIQYLECNRYRISNRGSCMINIINNFNTTLNKDNLKFLRPGNTLNSNIASRKNSFKNGKNIKVIKNNIRNSEANFLSNVKPSSIINDTNNSNSIDSINKTIHNTKKTIKPKSSNKKPLIVETILFVKLYLKIIMIFMIIVVFLSISQIDFLETLLGINYSSKNSYCINILKKLSQFNQTNDLSENVIKNVLHKIKNKCFEDKIQFYLNKTIKFKNKIYRNYNYYNNNTIDNKLFEYINNNAQNSYFYRFNQDEIIYLNLSNFENYTRLYNNEPICYADANFINNNYRSKLFYGLDYIFEYNYFDKNNYLGYFIQISKLTFLDKLLGLIKSVYITFFLIFVSYSFNLVIKDKVLYPLNKIIKKIKYFFKSDSLNYLNIIIEDDQDYNEENFIHKKLCLLSYYFDIVIGKRILNLVLYLDEICNKNNNFLLVDDSIMQNFQTGKYKNLCYDNKLNYINYYNILNFKQEGIVINGTIIYIDVFYSKSNFKINKKNTIFTKYASNKKISKIMKELNLLYTLIHSLCYAFGGEIINNNIIIWKNQSLLFNENHKEYCKKISKYIKLAK